MEGITPLGLGGESDVGNTDDPTAEGEVLSTVAEGYERPRRELDDGREAEWERRSWATEDIVMWDVIDLDDRVQVTATSRFPWNAICRLQITCQDGTTLAGTGWLGGPRTVITAGHCVYKKKHGGWAVSIKVIPGCRGASEAKWPYGSVVSSRYRTVKSWIESEAPSGDYGAILLAAGGSFASPISLLGFEVLGDAALEQGKLNLAGYPVDKPRGTQWFHAERLVRVTSTDLIYEIDTEGGQSGAPVWRLSGGERTVVGIHTTGRGVNNRAVRINATVSHFLNKWTGAGRLPKA